MTRTVIKDFNGARILAELYKWTLTPSITASQVLFITHNYINGRYGRYEWVKLAIYQWVVRYVPRAPPCETTHHAGDGEFRDLNKIVKLSMVVWVIANISGDQCGTGWLTVVLKNLYKLFFSAQTMSNDVDQLQLREARVKTRCVNWGR